jgi:DNA-binding CsgD family transcriptional regulator
MNQKRGILAPKEKECLHWVAEGKTAEEVAIIMNLKIMTVRSYLRLARQKLDCTTIANAVYKAAMLNLFQSNKSY